MLYEATGYEPTTWPDSYWRASSARLPGFPPLDGQTRADVAIIGAGYAGLNAALELVEDHSANVVVLEAAQPGWGASGRNGGFCCLGGARLDAGQITRRMGRDAAQDWDRFEHAAIARVKGNLARYQIDAQTTEPGEMLLAATPRAWAQMRTQPLPQGGALLDRDDLCAQGLNTGTYLGGRYVPQGFGLHPYAYATGLARAAQQAGVRLHGESRVTQIAPNPEGWRLSTATGAVVARQVLIASNGYSDERLVPWLARRILPAISNILVTRPLTKAELQAQGWTRHLMAYDDRILLHYFRLLPDNRLMFGARGGLSFEPASVARFGQRARAEFDLIFPQFRQAETEFAWNGLVCLTASRAPYIGPVPGAEGLWLALGWHGNGVAAASEGGRCAARAIMGDAGAPPALVRRPPPRFVAPRKWALAADMALAGLVDGPMRARPN
ncbi:glycine/D-amino acid oxidase-like deaminating enzyme [Roseinatronobacter thiooxidans]|uniref:Glycine/D-amino acid oxidase-like deaminating enzyme n=1 Tax=Roseinatronobacter thiooxidans TaxID=121821 RepID=A0A2W7SA08_9RHOB|nr:FAD-binding oxidoreductase [Roseinatronobacter thiooxidans]PZX47392.1 glycine/D-amino acid oxidase-like deaminating enzyme [Roseinatronobacter thiooxidans]